MRDWIEELIATGIMVNSPMGNRDDRIDANLHINREISIKSWKRPQIIGKNMYALSMGCRRVPEFLMNVLCGR